ncbi:LysR family transcriptional regulator [Phenylobacterium sp. Root77]|jgi:DNA-binding transcriptional LysR family regulator|uniref:LysR family transcriptional regulator n=1 Tax=unclassified Phenylobacterium TaxID=2640670 RepID=UPI000701B893|nr:MULTISPECIES: LysR family transcriptional regulator [unclassified Phenylobacterium]KQW65913.1 LysR family transcriptional regulator [Phenylobacterium sp. Root1277]KQW95622.1 LysR family transcriptional regulator [Phenylobacterium sp. Root1290]KRC41411.1 LysR family transcriptional regulator [Phenylobacterium sp. Root77]
MANADWDLFQSLHAVLQAGSLSAAAKARGLTQPTLGRHIEALESKLGAPLFLRSPRGLTPTDLARQLESHLAEMHAAAAAALRDASGSAEQLKGAIRITASQIMGAEVLPPILGGFRREHPEIDIELVLSNKAEDLSRRDADIAVRMIRPTQGALVARKVGAIGVGFYAAPEYVECFGAPQTLQDLTAHTVVGFDREAPSLQALNELDLPWEISRELFAFRSDNDLALIAAIRAGVGVGTCQHQIARRYGLTPVLSNAFNFELEVWIAMHENLKGHRRMRLMFDHLVAGFQAFIAEGRKA